MIHYINISKKRLVGRNNQPNAIPLVLDFHTLGNIQFCLIDDKNQVRALPENCTLTFAGSVKMGENSSNILFLSTTYTVSEDNVINFTVDTYTEPFLNQIKKKNTEINVEISIKFEDGHQKLLLRDYAYACPRVYIEGLPPSPVDYYYTKEEVDAKLDEFQPISGMVDYALKSDVPTKTSELVNDSGFITSGQVDFSDYYTKEEADDKFDEKADVDALSAYQPVSGMVDYALKSDLAVLDENVYYVDVNVKPTYETPGLLTKEYYESSETNEIISAYYTGNIAWEYTFENQKVLSKSSKWYFSDFGNNIPRNNVGNKSDIELNLYYEKNGIETKFASIKSDVTGNRITWPPSRIFKNLLTEDVILNPQDKLIFKIESFNGTKLDLTFHFYYAKLSKAYLQTGIYENIIPPDFILMSPAVPSNRTINSTFGGMQRGILLNKFTSLETDLSGKLSRVWGGNPGITRLYQNTDITIYDFCQNYMLNADYIIDITKIQMGAISSWEVIYQWKTKFAFLFYNPNGFTLKAKDEEGVEHILMTPEDTGWIYTEIANIESSQYNLGLVGLLFDGKTIILGDREQVK